MYNLLTEPCLTATLRNGDDCRMHLPQLLNLLEQDDVRGFPRLLPHQRHVWHALLVQLACLALEGETLPPARPGEPSSFIGVHDRNWWADALRKLVPSPDDAPWELVVEELDKPAFLQPPIPEGSLKAWESVAAPDDLDVLVTSKNHGVKQGRMNAPEAEDWLLALLSVQTQGGFAGSGLYGVARQNGGYGTRPGISLVASPFPGARWARDVRVILDNPGALAPTLYTQSHSRALLWLEPWDGKSQLPLEECHPLFVEICRRIRLTWIKGRIQAAYKATSCARLSAAEYKGNVGDPWIPIHRKEGKAFGGRPDYRNISLLFGAEGEYKPPLLFLRDPSCDPETGLALCCRILRRGQGTTEGYMERIIPIRGKHTVFFRDTLGEMAQRMVGLARNAEDKVLTPALARYLQGRKETAPGMDSTALKAWIPTRRKAMDDDVDELFFPAFWQALEDLEKGAEQDTALKTWRHDLRELAERHFREGLRSLPGNAADDMAAEARAWLFFYILRKKYLFLHEERGE